MERFIQSYELTASARLSRSAVAACIAQVFWLPFAAVIGGTGF